MFLVFLGFYIFSPVSVNASPTNAPMAVVMDFYTGEILFSVDGARRWIPASLTKSMAAFIVYEEIAAGNLTHDTPIHVSAGAARFSSDRRQPGSFVPIPSGAYLTVETLLQLMMIPSANAASVVMGEHISGSEAAFVERMNETAAAMGMYTSFVNSHGAGVHHSDTYSMAILMREFILQFPDILRITAMQSMRFNGDVLTNTNHHISRTPVDGLDGFKTGSLRQAGWNHSVTAERDGRRIIVVVMGTPDNPSRHRESLRLLEFGFRELERIEAERIERVRIFFGGSLISLESPPVIRRGQLMLPMRSVFEQLDYSVQWHEHHRLILLTCADGRNSTIFMDRNLAVVNGRTQPFQSHIVDDRIYISKQFIELVTGTAAEWNEATGVVQFRNQAVDVLGG